MSTQPPMRSIPDPLFGVTFELQSGATASKVAKGVTALRGLKGSLPHLPFLRIVFDENQAPSQYDTAVNGYQPYAYILGEFLDSLYAGRLTVDQYRQRVRDYLARHGEKVDVWEIFNEAFGGWAGTLASQGQKIGVAFDEVKAARKKSALTVWYNVGCVDTSKNEMEPLDAIDAHVPQRVRDGVDYVFISYYEVPCMAEGGVRITESIARTFFQQLHARFPNAKLGFGEIGLEDPSATNKPQALSILNHYYGLDLSDLPYYVGGLFWWYGWQDTATDWPDLMGSELRAGMAAMNAAIG